MAQFVTPNKIRVTATIEPHVHQAMKYYAEKLKVSENQFLKDALTHYLEYHAKGSKMQDIALERFNQLIDSVNALRDDVNTSLNVMTVGFDNIVALTRGDNYLLDEDDGELPD